MALTCPQTFRNHFNVDFTDISRPTRTFSFEKLSFSLFCTYLYSREFGGKPSSPVFLNVIVEPVLNTNPAASPLSQLPSQSPENQQHCDHLS